MIKIWVEHGSYGCETGCCGHRVVASSGKFYPMFDFSHPYGDDKKKFVEDMVADFVKKYDIKEYEIDWLACDVSDVSDVSLD